MHPVWVFALLGIVLATPRLHADPLPERSAHVADYDIRVALDTAAKQLNGHQRLTWRNPSTDTVADLWFHLYLNAFKNTRSTFYRESGGQLRDDRMPADGWGWIDVTSLKLADGTDLMQALRFEAPDDGNTDDRTVARVVLPRPVGPGESIAIDITFKAQLPKVFARTGYRGDYFLVGQWFPKLAVYEPAGMRGRAKGGWNCHQFHAWSEFYANFGQYRVEMTVPSHFVVGATGRRVQTTNHSTGTTTYVHEQSDVHDFAWTASPKFVELRRRFDARRDVSEQEYQRAAALLDRSIDEMRLSDVEVILLLQPAHRAQAERHFHAAMLALKWFGLWYGRYPHKTLTIVDPAFGAEGSAGMEYPTLVTAGTSVLYNRWPFDRIREPEIVTIHEIAHQFWQGLVANNEFEEAWLDEGIASYAGGKLFERNYPFLAELAGLKISELDFLRLQNHPARIFDAIRRPAWQYSSPSQYAFHSYFKPELVLRSLEGHLGSQTMARVMRTYHERWRFRHPSTDDFYLVVDDVSRRDMRSLLTQLFETGALVDYEISEVRSGPVKPPEGYIDGPKGRTLVREPESPEAAKPLYETTVLVRRRGDAVMPVQLVVAFEGTHTERIVWDGADRWKRFTFTRGSRLDFAQLDPARRLELDVDWLQNSRRLEPDRRGAAALTGRWLVLVQQVVSWLGL